MTPLQVIMLAHKMRQAQKSFQAVLSSGEAMDPPLMDRHSAMVELEAQLDAAIEPYVDYNRAIELQEKGHDS
jgi:hypothetical protein